MEVRKNRLEVRGERQEVRRKIGRFIGIWIIIFGLMAQSVLAVTVDVRIEGPTSQIWQGTVNASSTTIKGTDGPTITLGPNKAGSAIEAAANAGGFKTEYTVSGGLFLTTIAGIKYKDDWSQAWGYRVNYKEALLGLSDQEIKDGDQLLFLYSGWPYPFPLKLEVSKSNLLNNEALSITTSYFDDNTNSFKPISATVHIGNLSLQTDSNGQATTTLSNAGSYGIYAEKTEFVRSNKVQVVVGNVVTSQQTKEAVNRAQMFLKKRLAKNGRIENPAVTAWAAMAFASINIDPNKVMRKKGIPRKKWRSLMDYLLHYTRTSLNKAWLRKHRNAAKPLATDYARQIMAVTAAKKNPRNFGKINLVKELSRYYRGKQFGSASLVNDDIFTIIAYRSANVNPKLKPFKDAIRFVKKNQHADGGFSYSTNPAMSSEIDTTAAAIQALVAAKKAGIKNLDPVLEKAYNYLASNQNADGGFAYNSVFKQSNTGSTSWATQAIAAYKGSAAVDNLIASSGATPLYFASKLQNADMGFGYSKGSASDAWNTTQAIPALMKKPWPIKKR